MDDFYKNLMYNIKDINTILNNYKIALLFLELCEINKIFENTLSLRVAANGTKKPSTAIAVPAF